METKDLPYVVEYAKSNRSACKSCKENIGQDSLRIGIMVQSAHFDGKVPMWHHMRCFFDKKKIKVSSFTDFANFDNLRWEDQNKIKEKIANGPSTGKSKKGGESNGNSDFSVEYAKSGRAGCRTCGEKILKGEVRISKLITDTPEAQRYGPMPGWRHVDCFVKDRLELEYSDSADKLPGFNKLEDDDKKMLKQKLSHLEVKRKAEEANESASKKLAKGDNSTNLKRKAEESQNSSSKKMTTEEKKMKTQNDLLFRMRDNIKNNLSKKEMIALLDYNNQHISAGEYKNSDNLSDCLVFGALKKCPECKNAAPRFKIDAYRCSGNVTEWTKCLYVTRCPEREPFKIPEEFKEKYEFLRDYKYVKRDRFLIEKQEATNVTKGPLRGYIIVVFGKFNSPKSVIEKKVIELDGAIASKIDSSVKVCISTEKEVSSNSKNVAKARSLDIHIVSPKFLEDVKNGSTPAISMKENLICSWGGDPILKFGIKQENPKNEAGASSSHSSSSTSKSASGSKTVKLTVQGGAAVDPQSGMDDKSHVYKKKDTIFSVVLGVVDVSRDLNTYYKMQILESDKMKKYWLFRSWGRVGTKIGNTKLQNMKLPEAVAEFERLYLEKTGNEWKDRKNFVKKPGCLYPLDIDYGEESKMLQDLKPSDDCELPKPVQELICLIFDIEAMKKAMVEFEIDLQKMPLGKLSKKQIEQAYSVLNEAQQIIVTGCNSLKILDASNRFYTLIPHDFGLKKPPLLDNEELIKSKIEMLESLLEIELAYNLRKGEFETKDPVMEHYEKLNTDIDVLDKKSEEYKIIDKYVQNTHADTHKMYDLVLNKVFKISRHGENERYKAFQNLHNKKLLWHGSRLTNYVGILSQGLRIAPPEAPVTGYMFGKGIYFADMVSKSANYCFTNKKNPTGLLLLCEVALGDMLERKNADYINKLPKGKHSTKGLGMTIPDPKETVFLEDVEVPYGKPVKSDIGCSSLLYNEYIVYDVNQVNIKYLLDVTFKWKY